MTNPPPADRSGVAVDDVIITAELARRNPRPPDHAAENRALVDLAQAMADGVRARFGADVGLAVTGVAGPTGGTPKKPVGTVVIAIATPVASVDKQTAVASAWSRIASTTAPSVAPRSSQ